MHKYSLAVVIGAVVALSLAGCGDNLKGEITKSAYAPTTAQLKDLENHMAQNSKVIKVRGRRVRH